MKMRLIGIYVPAHTVFFLMKKEKIKHSTRSPLASGFLQELQHLSLGAGGSKGYTESVSPAWLLFKFVESERVEGQGC